MQENKGFWATFKKSLTDFENYSDFLTRSFWSATGYLYLLLVILAFVGAIKMFIPLLPRTGEIDKFVVQAKQFVAAGYPKELVVDVKNGQVSTNVPEPYYIDLPQKIAPASKTANFHLITIDTKAKIEDFTKMKTGLLVTKSAIITYDDKNSLKVYPLQSSYNFTLDKNKYDELTGKITPYLDRAKPFLIGLGVSTFLIVPFLVASSQLLGRLIALLLWSLLFLIIAKIIKKPVGYKQIYKLSIFGLTIPVLISTVQSLINLQNTGITNNIAYQQLSNVVFLIIMVVVLIKYPDKLEATPAVTNPSPPTNQPPTPTPVSS